MTVSTTTAESYTRWVESIEAMCRFIWVDHYSKGKKGVALENFPHVRLRTISNRFEEHNQKAYLDFLREQEKAARNAAQALKIGTMVGVAEGNAASPGRVRGKVPLPDGITVPELFTGHFFFGLEMKPAPPGHPPNKKVDFTGMVKNFKELCQELKSEYKAGETKLPEMNIVDRSKIPKWVLEATGVKEAPAAQSEQQDTLGAAQKTEDISAASAKSQVESVAAEESRKRPRDETEDPQTVKEPTGSTSVAAEPPPASTSADAALGLDF
jgi:poly(A) polymerase Pap1